MAPLPPHQYAISKVVGSDMPDEFKQRVLADMQREAAEKLWAALVSVHGPAVVMIEIPPAQKLFAIDADKLSIYVNVRRVRFTNAEIPYTLGPLHYDGEKPNIFRRLWRKIRGKK